MLAIPTSDGRWLQRVSRRHGPISNVHKMTVTYTFSPTATAEWYLLVRNEGQVNMDVVVKVELFGGMAWAWL